MIPVKILSEACAQLIVEEPSQADHVIAGFNKILVRYGKVHRTQIMEQIVNKVALKLGIDRYRVTSAIKLTDEQKSNLTQIIRDPEGDYSYNINTNLLGGVTIKTKDKVLDLSIKNKIEKIKTQLVTS